MAGIKITDLPAAPSAQLTDVFPVDQLPGPVTYKESNSQLLTLFKANGEALSAVNDSNITLTLGGSPGLALLNATSLILGWSGVLSPIRGGTGVNNGANTLTLGGNLTTSGAFNSTFTMTNTTNVTFPTSGTLATVGDTVPSIQGTANQVLVNATSGSPVTGTAITLTTPQDIGTGSSPTFAGLTAGNLNLTGNTLISTNANGNINIIPNGTGITSLGTSTFFAPAATSANQYFLQMAGSNINASMSIGSFRAVAGSGLITFIKSRNTTPGSHTVINSSDTLGNIIAKGDDGTNYSNSSEITFSADGAISTGHVPGAIYFYTSSTTTELVQALKIDSTQVCTFANALVGPGATFTKVNGTEAANAVTASGYAGVITTSSLTTAAGGSYAITWTNTRITSTSVITLTVTGGTNTVQNITFSCVPGSGTATLTIYNNTLATALNGTILISYSVL